MTIGLVLSLALATLENPNEATSSDNAANLVTNFITDSPL
jgi:hypothetical protein